VDVAGQYEPGQVRRLHGADEGHPRAEAVLDDLVDVLGAGDPPVAQGDRLPPHGVLETVAQEAWHVLEDADGHLARLLHEGDDRFEGGLPRLLAADHLHAGKNMRGVPEVGPEEAVPLLQGSRDLGDADGRCVARENGIGGREALHLGEYRSFQLQILQDGLEDVLAAAAERFQGVAEGDAVQAVGDVGRFGQSEVDEHPEVGLDPPLGRIERRPVRVVEADVVARRGKDLRDAVPHETGPDHADAPDVPELHHDAFLSLPLVGFQMTMKHFTSSGPTDSPQWGMPESK